MSQFLDYNEAFGVTSYHDQTRDGKLQLHFEQDVEPVLEYAKALRNDSLTDGGIKKDWWLYAIIPPIVILQLRHRGINIYRKADFKRAFDIINRDYPYLKTTAKKHTVLR